MQHDLGANHSSLLPASRRSAGSSSLFGRLVEPVVRGLDAEIEARSDALARDMELCDLARRTGDRESVNAFEFRMRETYGELLPRLVVRGLVNLMPHLGALLVLYHLLPVLNLPGGVSVSTVSAYIAVGITLLLLRALTRAARTRRLGHEDPRLSTEDA